ncbi:Adenosylmethionine-8-amino-7-oxononanoate transaminase [Hibiscus syriacus]|uniref:Adenosylmethionine-8-amino-7-oxononanoate transaminase n=1 Tax=Hibiscus syriacus TaxID=106335 RepID=A0A6A3B6E3_HIBSY|nr:Adenosylmethionine-8-amino-7-oxononanoate transaminase [Hibiscus syriacus]
MMESETVRIWMCEVCEQAPVAFTCKADAAALCVACNVDIHSANHLARRHHRVPVDPFLDASNHQQEDVIGSWALPRLGSETNQVKTGDLRFSQTDPFTDLEYHDPFQLQRQAMDGVVPVQIKPAAAATIIPVLNDGIENYFHVDFSCQSQSLSHSVSVSPSSSFEFGVVSDGNSRSDMSYPLGEAVIDRSIAVSAETGNGQAAQSGGMDREARVLRFREKRKKRKFKKTVRYAETRPRIKGRFVKRTQVDHIYNSPAAAKAAAFTCQRTTASSRISRSDDQTPDVRVFF